jgi:hypothetical protein
VSRARSGCLVVAVACAVGFGAENAKACAVCATGDPTLTVMGSERPYASRFRVSGELRIGGARVGEGASAVDLTEERVDFSAAYAPTRDSILSISIPLLQREAESSLGVTRALVLGDVELRVRGFVWQTVHGATRQYSGLQGGLKLPTAPVENGPGGAALAPALQPGGGSVAPFGGVFYGVSRRPWSMVTSATLLLPFPVRDGAHAAESLRTSFAVQRQVAPWFAARIGWNARLDGTVQIGDTTDPNSGGFVGYISPEIVLGPAMDLLITIAAHVPAVQALRGEHAERTILALGVTYDL